MLDIGGGIGLCSFYAAARGAEQVVCLEPEADGSNEKVVLGFKKLQGQLPFAKSTELRPITFQAFDPGETRFDIILLHNSINHLNEAACAKLPRDPAAVDIYQQLFAKLARISAPGASLIIEDCSRYNLFPLLKLTNPFFPAIEWEKHQSPAVWARLLAACGFKDARIRWTTFHTLGYPRKVLFGNALAAFYRIILKYLSISTFLLT
jgi:SAM-dependent methyltransferase